MSYDFKDTVTDVGLGTSPSASEPKWTSYMDMFRCDIRPMDFGWVFEVSAPGNVVLWSCSQYTGAGWRYASPEAVSDVMQRCKAAYLAILDGGRGWGKP